MIGIIDIGTNTILYLKASLDGREPVIMSDNRIHHRSGPRLDEHGKISGEYKAGLRIALLQALANLADCSEIKIVATEVLRRPLDGAEFARQLSVEIGWPIEIIDHKREAELSYAGAFRSMAAGENKLAVIDIGGGSTELALGAEDRLKTWSGIRLGAVAICEAIGYEKNYREYAQLARGEFDRSDFARLLEDQSGEVLAVGGSAVGIGALLKKQTAFVPRDIQGVVIARDELGELLERLSEMSLEQRIEAMAFDPQRSDIIVSGGAILWAFLELFEIEAIRVSTYGLRHGLLWELFGH